jgi:hypothetical protein
MEARGLGDRHAAFKEAGNVRSMRPACGCPEDDFTSWFPDDEPKTVAERLGRVRESLKEGARTGKAWGPTLFEKIEQREYERESRTPQPFLFYPQVKVLVEPPKPDGGAEPPPGHGIGVACPHNAQH